jgi:methylglyoxal synthase
MKPSPAKAIGVVAHDRMKSIMVHWTERHADKLNTRRLICTATTGRQLRERWPDWDIECVASGPKGGDQQIGACIVEGRIGALFFFIDPLTPMAHDVDVKALVRLATLYDIPLATAPATADCILESSFWTG